MLTFRYRPSLKPRGNLCLEIIRRVRLICSLLYSTQRKQYHRSSVIALEIDLILYLHVSTKAASHS